MRAILAFLLLASVSVVSGLGTRAEEPVTVSIVIKDHQFEPAEVHAPPGQPIMVRVKNLNSIAAEFESETLHVEKVIPPGGEATMRVRPLEVGRYGFFDDFHRATQGQLIVP
jgi:hypothetical protein